MDTWSKCKICLRDFLDEAQENSVEYRKTIIGTGTDHLFDELVVWSTLRNDEPLPFCHFCIESIEKINSLSNGCNKIKSKIETTVNKLTMESLRTRKVVKTSGELLPNSSADVKVRIKLEEGAHAMSNCIICYTLYMEGKSSPDFSTRHQKKRILKNCKLHLTEALRINECGFNWETLPQRIFTPFCKKCLDAVVRIGELNSKFEHAGEEFYTFVNSFTMESLKLKTSNAKKHNSNYREEGRRGGEGEDASDFEVDDTTNSTEVIEFLPSEDEGENDVVMFDPLILDGNLNTRTDNTADSRTITHYNVNNSTVTHPMSTSINVTVPNVPPARVASRHESPPLQNECMNSSYYDYPDEEESMERGKTLTTGRIINDLLESVPSPEQPTSSRKSLLPSRTRREGMDTRGVFSCPNCKKVYIQEIRLVKHMIQCGTYANHQEDETYIGMPNLVDYSHYPDVQISENRETLNVSPASSDCGERFDTDRRLTKRVTVSLSTISKPFSCKRCGESFELKNLLRSHTRGKNACKHRPQPPSVKPKRVFTFRCTFCPEEFPRAQDLSKHYQSHYDVALETRCTACGFVYSKKYQLLRHLKKKHDYVPNNDVGEDEERW